MNHFKDMSLEDLLALLRSDGWSVICHNDYKQYNEIQDCHERMTFWSFGHNCGIFVKGEAPTDREAVLLCTRAAHEVLSPSPGGR